MMAIDHLVYGVPALDPAVDELTQRFGVQAAPGGKHTGRGTHNALLSLGPSTYLEVIAPDPEQPQPSARPFGLDDLTVPRLVGWAIGCVDIDATIAAARAGGYDPGDAVDMTRNAPDGTVLRWRLTVNAVAGGPIPFLIAWGDTPQPASSAPTGLQLEAFEIEHPEPDSIVAVLAALGVDDVAVNRAPTVGLVAHIHGPQGTLVLR